jgi:hypothetical protein
MTKAKDVDLKELYNFLVNVSFEIIYPRKIYFKFSHFEIQFFQIISDGEMTKTKVVVLDDIYKFQFKPFS